MAAWAHLCRFCGDERPATAYVSAATVAEMPAACRVVQVRIDGRWRCALVDRDHRYAVDRMLLHDVCIGDLGDCPECAALLAGNSADRQAEDAGTAAGSSVHAAAVELDGRRIVVVLVAEALIDSPAEADMAIDRLSPHFSGAGVVLLAQREDGSPCYHGDDESCGRVRRLPLERLPWKVYPLT